VKNQFEANPPDDKNHERGARSAASFKIRVPYCLTCQQELTFISSLEFYQHHASHKITEIEKDFFVDDPAED
jgi:hypothetical protein